MVAVQFGAAQQDPEVPVQTPALVRLKDARGPGIPAPLQGLGPLQPVAGRGLWLAVGGRGRVQALGEFQEIGIGPQSAAHRAPQVLGIVQLHHRRVGGDLDPVAAVIEYRADRRYDHGVLALLLIRGSERSGQGGILGGPGRAGRGAGDGIHLHLPAADAQQSLGRGGHKARCAVPDADDLAGGEQVDQGGEQAAWVEWAPPLESDPPTEDHLVQGTEADLSEGGIHQGLPVVEARQAAQLGQWAGGAWFGQGSIERRHQPRQPVVPAPPQLSRGNRQGGRQDQYRLILSGAEAQLRQPQQGVGEVAPAGSG